MSTHFSVKELQCRCGCGFCGASADLIELAEQIRALWGVPIYVHSCCRCVKHNKEVGGAADSNHVKGRAMDFHVDGVAHKDAYNKIVSEYNKGALPLLGGIGLYSWGLHIDTEKAADGHLRMW